VPGGKPLSDNDHMLAFLNPARFRMQNSGQNMVVTPLLFPCALLRLCVIFESAEVFIVVVFFHFSMTEFYECCFIAVLICWHPYTFLLSI